MKKYAFFILFSFLFAEIPLIGDKAPSVIVESTEGKKDLIQDQKGKWLILWSFPSLGTPICTAEMKELSLLSKELSCKIIGVTTACLESEKKWMCDIQKETNESILLVSDVDEKVGKLYGFKQPIGDRYIRGVYIIDPDSNVRAVLFYPYKNGRNLDEIRRLLKAIQAYDNDGGMTLPNWKVGDKTYHLK